MKTLAKICACTIMVGFLVFVVGGIAALSVGLYNMAQPTVAEQHAAENAAVICKLDKTAC